MRYMEFDEILRGHGQRVPIKEAEIQKYAKKVAALYKEKIALLPDHVKSSMSIGAVVVDIGSIIPQEIRLSRFTAAQRRCDARRIRAVFLICAAEGSPEFR